MEAAANKMLASSLPLPPRTQLKQFSTPSALKLYEPAHSSMLATSLAQHFPTSVLIQEQRCESKPLLSTIRDDRTSQATVNRRQIGTDLSTHEEDAINSDQYVKEFQSQLLNWPGLWPKKVKDFETERVLSLARKALSASKVAASLADDGESFGVDLDNGKSFGIDLDKDKSFGVDLDTGKSFGVNLDNGESFGVDLDKSIKNVKFVKSTRLLERQSKRRKGPRSNIIVRETSTSTKVEPERKSTNRNSNSYDPLRLFLARPVTRQLLTSKEELELIAHIKTWMELEEMKSRFHGQFGCEPTLVEWAEAANLSCHELKAQLHRGSSSREKLIYANFRMVVHVAKQYQGRGLGLQDLMQEGSMGLMRSVHKFKPQAGCRFASYAYWWIRQTIRRALFQNSKLIRLPDHVYNLLYKVSEAKRACIREGHHYPTEEQIAAQAGMSVEKLQKLLSMAKTPISLQQTVWSDQNTTYQEITADTSIESTDSCVSKQLMRNHISNLLTVLSPKERKIIRLRYGIGGGGRKSLADVGLVFGVTKERIRQLESRSLHKLKQCSESQGLEAYIDLLV